MSAKTCLFYVFLLLSKYKTCLGLKMCLSENVYVSTTTQKNAVGPAGAVIVNRTRSKLRRPWTAYGQQEIEVSGSHRLPKNVSHVFYLSLKACFNVFFIPRCLLLFKKRSSYVYVESL